MSDSARDDDITRNRTENTYPSLPPSLPPTVISPYLQRNQIHPVKGVAGIVGLGAAQRQQQTVSAELDVVAHEPAVIEGGREGGGREGGIGEPNIQKKLAMTTWWTSKEGGREGGKEG